MSLRFTILVFIIINKFNIVSIKFIACRNTNTNGKATTSYPPPKYSRIFKIRREGEEMFSLLKNLKNKMTIALC